MKDIYNHILASISNKERLLAVLLDPDKMKLDTIAFFMSKVNVSVTTHIFIGGSTVEASIFEPFVKEVKRHTKLPVIIFPGDVTQISDCADAILFLSLVSGRNPDYLIDKHVKSVETLRNSNLEVIPTGYLLIENGKETAVQRVSQTKPLDRNNVQLIVDTAKAGEYLGKKLIYLEAGSGALHPVPLEVISKVKEDITIPLIVGGGIRSKKQLEDAYDSGADLVVIGTAFEEDETFFNELKK